MDWKTFKKPLKNTALICFIMFIVAAIIAVIVEAIDVANQVAGNVTDTSQGAVARLVLTIVSAVIMSIFAWLLNAVPPLVSLNYVMVNKKYVTKDEVVSHKKVTNPWWLHLALVVFLAIVFILSITSMIGSWNYNFGETIKNKQNLILCIISFFVNLAVFEFEFNYNCYKLNHDPQIKELM